MTQAGADLDLNLDEIMRTKAKNVQGGFSNAKATLRFYLQERKRMIDESQKFDLVTAQGLWYLVEPYIPTKTSGEFVKRKNFVSYIREICKDELHCRRTPIRIQDWDLFLRSYWLEKTASSSFYDDTKVSHDQGFVLANVLAKCTGNFYLKEGHRRK